MLSSSYAMSETFRPIIGLLVWWVTKGISKTSSVIWCKGYNFFYHSFSIFIHCL